MCQTALPLPRRRPNSRWGPLLLQWYKVSVASLHASSLHSPSRLLITRDPLTTTASFFVLALRTHPSLRHNWAPQKQAHSENLVNESVPSSHPRSTARGLACHWARRWAHTTAFKHLSKKEASPRWAVLAMQRYLYYATHYILAYAL